MYRSAELVALVPLAVLTVTSTTPLPAGAFAVRLVAETTDTEVADTDPNFTDAPATKFVPDTFTTVPPAEEPCAGLNPDTDGTASGAEPADTVINTARDADVLAGDCTALGATEADTAGSKKATFPSTVGSNVNPGVEPGCAEPAVRAYPKYNSPIPVGVNTGPGIEVDDALFCDPTMSLAHTLDAPNDDENSCTAKSTSLDTTDPENATDTDDPPVEVTVPHHNSESCDVASWSDTNRDHPDTPPPLTESTVTEAEDTFTASSRASPTPTGDTETEVTPEPAEFAKPPTTEIDGVDAPAAAAPPSIRYRAQAISATTTGIPIMLARLTGCPPLNPLAGTTDLFLSALDWSIV